MQPGDHPVEQTVDDLLRRQFDVAVLLHVRRRVEQVETDHGLSVMVGPVVPELLDQVAFRGEPVRLGIDQRAVHVPQHGGRQGRRGGNVRAHSWTSSIRVPKLPFGCTKATVVPRLPGRGALSIAVAPAAIIASSAAAQSSTR